MAPVGESKASAGIGTVVDITITVLGAVANTYEALGISPGDRDPGTHIDVYAENETYQAPSFKSGEFNISMYHTQGDLNFLKQVKVRYPNGKIEIHQLKSGQRLKITEAGAIIDLNPNADKCFRTRSSLHYTSTIRRRKDRSCDKSRPTCICRKSIW